MNRPLGTTFALRFDQCARALYKNWLYDSYQRSTRAEVEAGRFNGMLI